MEKRITALMLKDDVTNFFLLYRKLVNTSYEEIGVYTVYNSGKYRNLLNQELLSLFPRMTYIGPTAVYERFIELANYPHNVDLEKYNKNLLNLDIVPHLSGYKLDDVYPNQKTAYTHSLHIHAPDFENGEKLVDSGYFNLGLNLIDSRYDIECLLSADVPSVLDELVIAGKRPKVYVYGIVQDSQKETYLKILRDYADGYEMVDCTSLPYSTQIGTMLHLDMLMSGSYSWGVLAYTMNVPTLLIYPYYMSDMKENITGEGRKNYIEVYDEEVSVSVKELVRNFV